MTFLDQAKHAVERLLRCNAVHVETTRVCQIVGNIIWDADIEVFALDGYSGAQCCYVWGLESEDDGKFEFVVVPSDWKCPTPTAAVHAVLDWENRHGHGAGSWRVARPASQVKVRETSDRTTQGPNQTSSRIVETNISSGGNLSHT